MGSVAVIEVEECEVRAAEPRCAGEDRLEYRLQVGRRATDNAQDVRRGGLPFEGILCLIEEGARSRSRSRLGRRRS
jgi:hypothetical protein